MKILVPVDFSAHSKNAAAYAAKMAQKCNAEIILLNLVFLQAPPHAAELNQHNIEKVMKANAKKDCVQLMEELKTKNKKLLVSYEVINDFNLKEVIENYAVHNNIDLIIMGTKGATGLSKVLLGSNTAAVIGNSSIPVIAVPQHARFNGIKQIVYASDMLSIHKELTAVIPIVKKFKAHLQIVHVLQPDSKKSFDIIRFTHELRT
jgi:nucleotide-binding universal stress UspA family protein